MPGSIWTPDLIERLKELDILGLTQGEIAEELRVDKQLVKSKLARIRAQETKDVASDPSKPERDRRAALLKRSARDEQFRPLVSEVRERPHCNGLKAGVTCKNEREPGSVFCAECRAANTQKPKGSLKSFYLS